MTGASGALPLGAASGSSTSEECWGDEPRAHSAVQALAALCGAARLLQVAADPEQVAHDMAWGSAYQPQVADLLRAAKHIGLKARATRPALDRLSLQPLPALVRLNAPAGEPAAGSQWAVLARCDGQRALLQVNGQPRIEPLERLAELWSGDLLLLSSQASLAGEAAAFDFSWFVPSLVRYRRLLGEVLLVSLVLQLFALVSPLFFQTVMDKVLVHQATSTLNVLVTGLVFVVVFESVLSMLRTYVFSHTTNRIDVELGSKLYRHLLSLPLAYFEHRRVGDSVARAKELETIRGFLTGTALTLVLDAVFSVVFIGVMFLYSTTLTLIVLLSLPLYAIISAVVVPVLKRRLDEKFARGAENQSLLVESISGISTVKANALEPQLGLRWDQQLAAYVRASFQVSTLAAYAHESIGLVGKLVNAATLWWGAHLVMQGELTVGMFVAFNMFAGRVAQPIMRMAQMWTDFQQTGLSVRRLGDILNCPSEAKSSHAAQLPPLQGHISLDQVSFAYRPDAPPVLRQVSLDIRAGEVIGIVGRSGSGKSTLTKLIQRLYTPQQGRVLIDGQDISLINVAQLRRQLGVVLQDNLLFNRSVRENIAITDPAAPLEAVITAATLAGAHEFISELPEGYDTVVGEQGTGLSGGQRQRIAVARALFAQPRILIFDEATSALDYESEAILQRNMGAICQGRTVLIIAHRLSAVRQAHRIVVMDQGQIAECGSHAELLARNGPYAALWRLQQAGPDTSAGGQP
jgi:ATP-binding cassette, subfamily B, bacterial HlyB/CyaB